VHGLFLLANVHDLSKFLYFYAVNISIFGASQGLLPDLVLAEVQEAILDFPKYGSVLYLPHRSEEFLALVLDCENRWRKLMDIPADYAILFLQGGASLGFLVSALNLHTSSKRLAYAETGLWAQKAIEEARKTGLFVDVLASGKSAHFAKIPALENISKDFDFLHITANNTVYGTQYQDFPNTAVPLVADLTSEWLTRKIPVEKFALLYGGTQKHVGIAGLCVYIVKKDLLGRGVLPIPNVLNLQNYINNQGVYHTPNVFAIYVMQRMLCYLESQGGVAFANEKLQQNAKQLYQMLEKFPSVYHLHADESCRSVVNIVFFLQNQKHQTDFEQMLANNNILGLQGHRSFGGYRISLYLSTSPHQILQMCQVLQDFALKVS
jgi:phosphoserine aminotransferase